MQIIYSTAPFNLHQNSFSSYLLGNKVKRAVSGENSYRSVHSLSISTISHPPLTLYTPSFSRPKPRFVSLPGYRFVCIERLGALSRAQAVAAIQKCIAKIPSIEGELLSLPWCIGKSRSVKWLENVISTGKLTEKKRQIETWLE